MYYAYVHVYLWMKEESWLDYKLIARINLVVWLLNLKFQVWFLVIKSIYDT